MSISIRDELGLQHGSGVEPWHREAACKDFPLSRFFEEQGSLQKARGIGDPRAKRVCSKCPVRRDCSTEALSFEKGRWQKDAKGLDAWVRNLPVGTWGGMNERERWAPDVTHLPDCASHKRCRGGCRPIPERVEMLEERFRAQADQFLVAGESIT